MKKPIILNKETGLVKGIEFYEASERNRIELEGFANNPQWLYTDAQYATLIELTKSLMQAYPLITSENIAGHEHIAPERKTDPGHYFDWNRFCTALGIPQLVSS